MCDKVLKIDVSGSPISYISWQEFIRLWYLGKANIISAVEDEYWHSPSIDVPKAAVIQVDHYVKLKPQTNTSVRKAIVYARDEGKCQYCEIPLSYKESSLDHVVPKHHFKKNNLPKTDLHSYTNVVLACVSCNFRKGNKLPKDCGMYPIKTPKIPTYVRTQLHNGYHHLQKSYIQAYYKLSADPNEESIEIQ